MQEKLYADYELDSDNMFVVTPEGNRFVFRAPEYTDAHEDETIIDPASHKTYIVCFNE